MFAAPRAFSRQLNAVGSPMLAHMPAQSGAPSTTLVVPKVIGATLLLLLLSAASGVAIWLMFANDASLARNFGFGAGVVAFSLAFIASFKPQLSGWLAPLYAIAGGLFAGGLSLAFEARFPGIAVQTVLVTGCVFATMLMLYSGGWLRPPGLPWRTW